MACGMRHAPKVQFENLNSTTSPQIPTSRHAIRDSPSSEKCDGKELRPTHHSVAFLGELEPSRIREIGIKGRLRGKAVDLHLVGGSFARRPLDALQHLPTVLRDQCQHAIFIRLETRSFTLARPQ